MVQYRALRAGRRAKLTEERVHILHHSFCSHLAMQARRLGPFKSSPDIASLE